MRAEADCDKPKPWRAFLIKEPPVVTASCVVGVPLFSFFLLSLRVFSFLEKLMCRGMAKEFSHNHSTPRTNLQQLQ